MSNTQVEEETGSNTDKSRYRYKKSTGKTTQNHKWRSGLCTHAQRLQSLCGDCSIPTLGPLLHIEPSFSFGISCLSLHLSNLRQNTSKWILRKETVCLEEFFTKKPKLSAANGSDFDLLKSPE